MVSDPVNRNDINYRIYVIIDEAWIGERDLKKLTEDVLSGGATLVQYRCKSGSSRYFYEQAKIIHDVCKAFGVPLIINDRADISLALNTEGVHLGQEDLPADQVRNFLGREKIIGLSVTKPEDLSSVAAADYLGVGAVFPTKTKPDAGSTGLELLRLAGERTALPVVAIGGIQPGNIRRVFQSGADGAALISAVLGQENPEQAVKELRLISEQEISKRKSC